MAVEHVLPSVAQGPHAGRRLCSFTSLAHFRHARNRISRVQAAPARQETSNATSNNLTVTCYDLHDQIVPYEQAWRWQQQLLEHMLEPGGGAERPVGAVILLQHEPVYTLGAGSSEAHLRFDTAAPPLPLHRTERGGEVTYHGPGQLVLYPVLDLRRLTPDLHWYLRSLEEVAIRTLAAASGLAAGREEGLTGVWAGGGKVAAIGVRARRWVTYHGLALNVAPDLTPFSRIVPCGIADRPVTSVRLLLDSGAGGEGAGAARQGDAELLALHAAALLEAFREVFGVALGPAARGALLQDLL